MEELGARFVHALVGMGAKVISLRLEQVRGQHGAAVLIVKSQGGAEGRNGNAFLRRRSDDVPPTFLALLDFAAEIIVQQKIHQLGLLIESFLDLTKKTRADDA